MELARSGKQLLLVFAACMIALGYFTRPIPNPNENSRMALVLAAFWHQTLAIDAYQGRGRTRTSDKSRSEGHFYSDKAPGSSMLGALGYAPVHVWERATGREAPYLVRKYSMTLTADALPVAAALCALFVLASSVAGARAGAGVTLAGLLATPLLPFGSSLFGHGLAGAVLFLAFFMVRRVARGPVPPRWGELLGAGALLGLAVATEYTTAPACVGIAIYGLSLLRRRGQLGSARVWLGPVLGALPFALGVAAYNYACFGSPFSLGYENLASPYFRSLHAQGLVGIRAPHLDVAYYLTLHPARGLFVHAPVLLLAAPGLWTMLRRPGWRAEAVLCGAVFLSFLLLNSGFGLWWGGYTYTARHLVPAIPFLLLPLAFVSRKWWWIGVPLFLASTAQTLIAAFGDPFSSDGYLVGRLREVRRRGGGLVPWAGSWSVYWDVWPLLRSRSETGLWIGFPPNAARLLGLRGPASAIPLLVIVPALLAWAARTGPAVRSLAAPRRSTTGLAAALRRQSGEGAA